MANVYVEDVVNIAIEEDGYLEKKSNAYLDDKTKNAGNKNYTKYARDIYQKGKSILNGNKQGSAYCAVGTIWDIFKASGWSVSKTRYVLCLPNSPCAAAGVKYYKAYFESAERYDKNPKVGDIIFFNHDKDKDPEHVGLVIKVTDKQVKTEEWNTSKNGKQGVFQKTYNRTDSKILGYGHPRYDTKPSPEPPEPTPPTPEKKLIKASKPASKGPDKALNREFKVKSSKAAIKDGPSSNSKILTEISINTKVRCYGYYSVTNGVDWPYIRYEDELYIYEGFICEKSLEVV